MSEGRWEAEVDIRVPFHDADMMGIAWHGHYAKYFEIARTRLLSRFDYDYRQMRDSGYAWPVIELHVRYAQPLPYEARVTVKARIVEYENRLKVAYEVRDADTGRRLTRGHTVQVAVHLPDGEMCFASPPVLLEKLGVSDG